MQGRSDVRLHLVVVGLSHHEAPIEVRERLSCTPHSLPNALSHLAECEGVQEAVIVSTCNRMEVYATIVGADTETACRTLTHHLSSFHQVPESAFANRLFHRVEGEVATHLFRVASGLDSLIVGEPQILGQVRDALRTAQGSQVCGPTLTKLFMHALTTGKRVRTETGLGHGGFSVGHAAVRLAQRILDDFSRARVLILGAGKMSELTAGYLKRNGVQFVVVANRTYERAVAMAQRLGGQAIQYDTFLDEMVRADIVISSTAAPHPILRRDMLAPVMKKRRGKPLFLIDIALPRDIDPDVNELDNVYLRNIDDLQGIVEQQAQGRADESQAAEKIVMEETGIFLQWLRGREAAPVIARLRSHLDSITEARLEILRGKLPALSDREWQIIATQMRALTDQIALNPTRALKQSAVSGGLSGDSGGGYDLIEATSALFGLPEKSAEPSVIEVIESIKDSNLKVVVGAEARS